MNHTPNTASQPRCLGAYKHKLNNRQGIKIRACLYAGIASALLLSIATENAFADNEQDTLYSTSFEQPTFTAGLPLVGNDHWVSHPALTANENAAVITRDAARRGRQSVEVRGTDMNSMFLITDPYDSIALYRQPLPPPPLLHGDLPGYKITHEKPVVRIEADMMLATKNPVPTEKGGDFFSQTINMFGVSGGSQAILGEIGLSSEGIVEAYPLGTTPSTPPIFKKRIQFNKWYHITIVFDYVNRRTSYRINDDFLGRTTPAPFVSNLPADSLVRGNMVVYAKPDGDPNRRSSYTSRFDNFRISVEEADHDGGG